MKLTSLNINNLRNHSQTYAGFAGNLNVFYGLNGSGKTTVLEAISICGVTKSFLPVQDSSLISYGKDFYNVSASAINELSIPYKINIKYTSGSKKQINSSIGDNLSPKDVIGEMPLVVLSPDFKSITFGAPQDRRDFLDRLLSQSGKVYFEELLKFRKILKQRNNLLVAAKQNRFFDTSQFELWTEMMIKTGAEIAHRRMKFINEFIPFFRDVYFEVSSSKEAVSIEYAPNSLNGELKNISDKHDIIDIYTKTYNNLKTDEYRRGLTLFGPQKDDIKIYINSGIAREYASQGQHKSLLISIKFAEFNYLKSRRDETPVVLLDDIFSELDNERAEKVFDLVLRNNAQTFVTVTDASNLKTLLPNQGDNAFFSVSGGIVTIIGE